jgi:hypothetical protein
MATKQIGHGFGGSGFDSDRFMPAYDYQRHRPVNYGCFLSAVRNPSYWLCRELLGERSGLSRISEAPPNKTGTVIAPPMATLRFNAMPSVKVIHSN